MTKRSNTPPVDKVSDAFVEALSRKLRSEDPSQLDASDMRVLGSILDTWAHLNRLAGASRASIRDVRKVLDKGAPRSFGSGKGDSSAERQSVTPAAGPDIDTSQGSDCSVANEQTSASTDKNRNEHGRRDVAATNEVLQAHHEHTILSQGCHCPSCLSGRLYVHTPCRFTAISGQPALVATQHTVDVLRCNQCKAVFKAPLPDQLNEDGLSGRTLYTFSAVAIVCIYRFFGGLPMHRQQNLQGMLGVHVPDASMWDMGERLADVLRPIARLLWRLAASARTFFGDDTGAVILSEKSKTKVNRRTGKEATRTGCHTTGVIAVLEDGAEVVLFATGIHHTGEVMDRLLAQRDKDIDPPIFMGDCCDTNVVTTAVVLYAACNAHAVRRFKELKDKSPDEAAYALERYRKIYDNEDHCKDQGFDAEARCDYHRIHSRSLLREITEYAEDSFEQRTMEPNSDIGKAFEYVINNERRLAAFARHPHAPIDNNRVERALRIFVRLRETSHFFRNSIGSSVADTVLTTGATALANGSNLFEYFVGAQRHAEDVRANPHLWLPWNFMHRLRELATKKTGVGPPGSPVAP